MGNLAALFPALQNIFGQTGQSSRFSNSSGTQQIQQPAVVPSTTAPTPSSNNNAGNGNMSSIFQMLLPMLMGGIGNGNGGVLSGFKNQQQGQATPSSPQTGYKNAQQNLANFSIQQQPDAGQAALNAVNAGGQLSPGTTAIQPQYGQSNNGMIDASARFGNLNQFGQPTNTLPQQQKPANTSQPASVQTPNQVYTAPRIMGDPLVSQKAPATSQANRFSQENMLLTDEEYAKKYGTVTTQPTSTPRIMGDPRVSQKAATYSGQPAQTTQQTTQTKNYDPYRSMMSVNTTNTPAKTTQTNQSSQSPAMQAYMQTNAGQNMVLTTQKNNQSRQGIFGAPTTTQTTNKTSTNPWAKKSLIRY